VAVTMTVEATTPPIETNTGTFSTVVENKMFMDLPLDGRNPYDLVLIAPGVTPGSRSVVISGGRPQTSEYAVDGTSVSLPGNLVSTKETAYTPNIDSVQEFSVQTNSLAAEYGRSGGGVVNVATKGGTNQIHGSAFEFLRNSKLDANNFFSNRAGIKLAAFQRNQYGGTVGGPIYVPHAYDGRNRTFFFFDYQGTKGRSASIFTGSVPLPEWIRGDLSTLKASSGQTIVVSDPVTNRANPGGGYIRDPFPGNQIPASRIDPTTRAVAAYYPAANATPANASQANNYIAAGKAPSDNSTSGIRVDHNVSDRYRIFGRFTYAPTLSQAFNAFNSPATPSGGQTMRNFNTGASVDQTVLFGPGTVFNLRLGFGRYRGFTDSPSKGFDLRKLNFQESVAKVAELQYPEFPRFDLTNMASVGTTGYTPLRYAPMSYVVQPSLTKVLNRHTIKAGMESRRGYLNHWGPGYPSGYYTFSPAWTQQNPDAAGSTSGHSLASFLLGLPLSGYFHHDSSVSLVSQYWGGYLQDEFHVTKRLTLNFGVRYEVDIPKKERYNRLSWLDLGVPSPLAGKVAGYPNLVGEMKFATPDHPQQVDADINNVGPRVGLAYKLDGKTVVRAAYGMMYGESIMAGGGTTGGGGVEGFSSRTFMIVSVDGRRPTVDRPLSNNPFPTWNMPLGPAPGPLSGASTDLGLAVQDSYFDASLNSRIQQWNMTLTRAMPANLILQAGYSGSRGMHLLSQESGQTYNQLPSSNLSLGTHLNDAVANPFYGLIPNSSSVYYYSTIARRYLLQPYPQYSGINSYRRPIGDSNYHSMILRVDRRFSNGAGLLASFTAGKIMDNSSSGWYLGQLQDFYNRRADHSVASEDISRRLVVSGNYELPFGRGRRFRLQARPLEHVFGGWQINGIASFQTGVPVPITQTLNNTGLGSAGQRPSNNGKSGKIEGGTRGERIVKWFDPTVFSQTPYYAWGNSSRTSPDIRSPGLMNLNMSLFKNVRFLEQYTLQIRAEAFNASNRVNLGTPNGSVNASTFGVINSAGAARQVQMGLRMTF
jgi:hypothetical protein